MSLKFPYERGIIRLLRRLGLSQTLIKKSLEIFPWTDQIEKKHNWLLGSCVKDRFQKTILLPSMSKLRIENSNLISIGKWVDPAAKFEIEMK